MPNSSTINSEPLPPQAARSTAYQSTRPFWDKARGFMLSMPSSFRVSVQEYVDGFRLAKPYFWGKSSKHLKHWVLLSSMLGLELLQVLLLNPGANKKIEAMKEKYKQLVQKLNFQDSSLLAIVFFGGRLFLKEMLEYIIRIVRSVLQFYFIRSITIEMKSHFLKEWVETKAYYGEIFFKALGIGSGKLISVHEVLDHDIDTHVWNFYSKISNSFIIFVNLAQTLRGLKNFLPLAKQAVKTKNKGVALLLLLQTGYGVFSYALMQWLLQKDRALIEKAMDFEHAAAKNLQALIGYSEPLAMRGGAEYEMKRLLGSYQESNIQGQQVLIGQFRDAWWYSEMLIARYLGTVTTDEVIQAKYPFFKDYLAMQETTMPIMEAYKGFAQLQSVYSNITLDHIKTFQSQILQWKQACAASPLVRTFGSKSTDIKLTTIDIVNLNRGDLPMAHLSQNTQAEKQYILQGRSLNIPLDKFILLSGPSGTGKSVLLKVLLGLYPFASGQMDLPFAKENILALSQRGYMPIDATLLEVSRFPDLQPLDLKIKEHQLEAEQLIYLVRHFGLHEKFRWPLKDSPEEKNLDKLVLIEQRIKTIERLNVTNFEISGGEEQRIAIISLLLQIWRKRHVKGNILVLIDENFNQLDGPIKTMVQKFMLDMKKRWHIQASLSFILIDHAPLTGLANKFYSQIMRFKQGLLSDPVDFTKEVLLEFQTELEKEAKNHKEELAIKSQRGSPDITPPLSGSCSTPVCSHHHRLSQSCNSASDILQLPDSHYLDRSQSYELIDQHIHSDRCDHAHSDQEHSDSDESSKSIFKSKSFRR